MTIAICFFNFQVSFPFLILILVFLHTNSSEPLIGYIKQKIGCLCFTQDDCKLATVSTVFPPFPLSISSIIPHFLHPIVCFTPLHTLCFSLRSVTPCLPSRTPQASVLQQEKQGFISRILNGTVRFGKLQEEVKVSSFLYTINSILPRELCISVWLAFWFVCPT